MTHPATQPRRRGMRLLTLMLLIGLIAAALGLWSEFRRRQAGRQAVGTLIGLLPNGVLISIAPLDHLHDPVHDPNGVFTGPIRRIKSLSAERPAVSALLTALHDARGRRDEKVMRAALACLEKLDPGPEAVHELVATIEGRGLVPDPATRNFALVRGLAVHVLGKVAERDVAAVAELGRIVARETSDPHQDGADPGMARYYVTCTAINEVNHFGPKAKSAIPHLRAILAGPAPDLVAQQIRYAAILALVGLGPEARPAVPDLLAELRSNYAPCRGAALMALDRIAATGTPGPEPPTVLQEEIAEAVRPLLDDPDEYVRILARQYLARVEQRRTTARRHRELQRMLAQERSRAGAAPAP